MAYDDNNVFARILRGEIPATKVYEDEYVLAFRDIAPQAPVHVLVIPKAGTISTDDLSLDGVEPCGRLLHAVGHVARLLGLDKTGYRVIANHGADAHQAVPHMHFHILGGGDLGPGLLPRRDQKQK